MKEDITAIPLRRVSYSDSRAIITAYTRERGTLSLLALDGPSKGARRQRALLRQASAVTVTADISSSRDIHPIASITPLDLNSDIGIDPTKAVVAMFLTEILDIVLRASAGHSDPPIFDYLRSAFRVLDKAATPRATANFSLCFLYRLGAALGLEPDASTWQPGTVFDMRGGIYRPTPPPHADMLVDPEASAAARMARMTFDNMEAFVLTRAQRNAALDHILRYLALHTGAARLAASVKSLDVARDIF